MKTNKWARVGLGVGILSVFFAFIGIIPLSGIVINSVAIYKSKAYSGSGKWQAIIGLILSIIYTMVYLNRYGYI